MNQRTIGADGNDFNLKQLLEFKKTNLVEMQEKFREMLE